MTAFDFSTADFVAKMAELGAPVEAITHALRAIEGLQSRDKDRREKRAAQKRKERNISRDDDATVARQGGDIDATVADAPLPPCPPSLSPDTPIPTPLNPPAPVSRSVDDDFAEFWQAYPRRDGPNPKKPAREKFGSAVKHGTLPSEILAGATAYRAECERKGKIGTEFIPHAATWLHQRRWEEYAIDDPPPPDGPQYPAATAMMADDSADCGELFRIRQSDGWDAAERYAMEHHRTGRFACREAGVGS